MQLPLDFAERTARGAALEFLESLPIGAKFCTNDIIGYVQDTGLHAGWEIFNPSTIKQYERETGIKMHQLHKTKCIYRKGG